MSRAHRSSTAPTTASERGFASSEPAAERARAPRPSPITTPSDPRALDERLRRARRLGHDIQRVRVDTVHRAVRIAPEQSEHEADAQRFEIAVASARPVPSAGDVEPLDSAPLDPALQPFADPGQALPATVRPGMERALGHDLSRVEIHAGPAADRLNRALGSRAATSGRHLFFKRGHYRPESESGRRLLGHELAHTTQQQGFPGLVQRATDPAQLAKTAVLKEFEFEGMSVGQAIEAKDKAMGGVARDANSNNLVKRQFEEALATFVFHHWDLVEQPVLKVSEGVRAYFAEKERLALGTRLESMQKIAEKETTLGYPGFPSADVGFTKEKGEAILSDKEKSSLPAHLNVHGKFSFAMYSGEEGDFGTGDAAKVMGGEPQDYFAQLTPVELFGKPEEHTGDPGKGRPRVPMDPSEKDQRPQAEHPSGLAPLANDQRLPIPDVIDGRPTDASQKHGRGGDAFYVDESKRWTQEARLVYDMPVMAGPSGSAAHMLATAKVMGLSGSELWLYSMALVGSIVAGGHHSFHEVMTVAQLAGVPYSPGDYLASIPPEFWANEDFQQLVGRFYEPAGEFAEKTRGDSSTSERRAQDLRFGLTPISDNKEDVLRFLATRLGVDPKELELKPVNAGGNDTKGVSGSPVFFVEHRGKPIGVLKRSQNFEEMAQELSGMKKLESLPLEHLDTPEVMALGKVVSGAKEAGLLFSSLAPGEPLDDLMVAAGKAVGDRPKKFAALKAAVQAVGRGLAELHTKSAKGGQVDKEYVALHIAKVEQYAHQAASDPIGKQLIDPGKLGPLVDEVVSAFRKAPGDVSSIVHGDAHPGNFFVSESGVSAIDLPTLDLSVGAGDRPLGSPARDTANFLRKLESVGKTSGLTVEEIGTMRKAFEIGYAEIETVSQLAVPEEAMRFFRLRTLLSELRNALKAKDAETAGELVGEIYKI